LHLLRRILQVVVHRDHVSSACVAQPRQVQRCARRSCARGPIRVIGTRAFVRKEREELGRLLSDAAVHLTSTIFVPAQGSGDFLKRADEFPRHYPRPFKDRDERSRGRDKVTVFGARPVSSQSPATSFLGSDCENRPARREPQSRSQEDGFEGLSQPRRSCPTGRECRVTPLATLLPSEKRAFPRDQP